MEHKIVSVKKNSIASELEIEIGELLLEVNGKEVNDILEYIYEVSSEYIEITIKREDNSIVVYEIEKEYDEEIGIEFENPVLSKPNSCKNNCIFCFIDQLPKGLRKTLYFKDDDSRLSFLHGNYITLTNLSDQDIDRIIKLKISPINISVHTTNPELRLRMMKNPKSVHIMKILKRFVDNDIIINGQVVLCPGFNDNKELDKTIVDLFNLGENFNNLAIVPVGISKYREGLEKLEPVTFEKANQVINQVERYQKEIYNVRNRNFVYLSDEFYLTAKREFPKYSEYDGFPQIENGIGLTVKFNYEIDKALENVGKSNFNGKISIVTGFSAYENLMKIKEKVEMKFPIIKIDVIKIKNNFFGDKITVAGLITGSDILEQVDIMRLGEKVILPDVMFKDKENVFLDDTTLSDIELKFNRKISVVSVNGYEFISELIK
jgi:putative radical SAM enzyme (TIGR03279 family)